MQEIDKAEEIIEEGKRHLKEQGVDQWQNGYPDRQILCQDLTAGKGYFVMEGAERLGYLCIDFDGESAYDEIQGSWHTKEPYMVVHRMAFTEKARGKRVSEELFRLAEEMSRQRGVFSFRVDTDRQNQKMQHILAKNGFFYCGTIWFDASEKSPLINLCESPLIVFYRLCPERVAFTLK